MNKLDVLALGAHPDDVEMSCSGTLLAAVAGCVVSSPAAAEVMARLDACGMLGGGAAAAALVAPASLTFKPAHMVAECTGRHTRGMTVVEWRVKKDEKK